MDYRSIYNAVIDKYGTWKKPKGVYTERHRKVPGHLGGTYVKGNAFYVPARVHFICHLLLVKLYPGEKGILTPAFRMSNRRKYGSKHYSWVKSKWACEMREVMKTNSNPMKNPESVAKVSGERSPTKRAEVRAKISSSKIGMRISADTKVKMSNSAVGKPKTKEHNESVSKAKLGVPNVQTRYVCECGLVSTGSGLHFHQKSSGHIGKECIK